MGNLVFAQRVQFSTPCKACKSSCRGGSFLGRCSAYWHSTTQHSTAKRSSAPIKRYGVHSHSSYCSLRKSRDNVLMSASCCIPNIWCFMQNVCTAFSNTSCVFCRRAQLYSSMLFVLRSYAPARGKKCVCCSMSAIQLHEAHGDSTAVPTLNAGEYIENSQYPFTSNKVYIWYSKFISVMTKIRRDPAVHIVACVCWRTDPISTRSSNYVHRNSISPPLPKFTPHWLFLGARLLSKPHKHVVEMQSCWWFAKRCSYRRPTHDQPKIGI